MAYTGHYQSACPVCHTPEVREVHEEEERGEKWTTYVCENDHQYEVSWEGWIEEIHEDGDDR